ncbi:MAG TPA: electron transport complex subunit RsxC [Steroidobacteraceae bacterium]|nr:electron transport complex subunit RsxC [Steroidobacteraceae bacterium]
MATSRVRGGLRLNAHKERSTEHALRPATAVESLVLPLDQHAGAPAVPLVKRGDRVLRGQPLAGPGGAISAWLHSPVSGTISAIEPRPAPHRLGAPALSIVVSNDGRDERHAAPSPTGFEQMAPEQLRDAIDRGGIVGLGGAVFPTAAKLRSAAAATSLRLLLNGAECEPYISCDDMLMRERARDIVFGARVLLHALAAQSCVIAIEDDTVQAAASLEAALSEAHDERIRLRRVASIYPAGGEKQLITTIFGVEVPHDGLPANVGVACLNVGTAAAVAQWIRDAQPLTRRIVTVTGDGVREQRNLEVPLGTSLGALIYDCGGYTGRMARLIMGGSMMGQALPHDDMPVIKATNCVIAASAVDLQPRGPEMPCIRCGNCSVACPAMLLPQQLHWYAQARDLAALETHGLMDCIECGCCDYVCPSQIPLVERFRDMKPALAAQLAARTAADAARARFDARTGRLERIESERSAVLARKRQELAKKSS